MNDFGSLVIWEFKKILRQRSAKVAFTFAIITALFSTIFNGVYRLGSTTEQGARNWDGPAEITRQYQWAEQWQGNLTDEKLTQAKQQYNVAYLPQNAQTFFDGSVGPSNEAWHKYIDPLGGIPNFLQRTFYILPEYQDYSTFKNLPISYVEDYYNQRGQILEKYLKSQILKADDIQIFLEQNAKVKTPFYYDWYQGQNIYLEMYSDFALFTAMALCIGIASLFSGEYQKKTDSVLLCSKFGRKKLAYAKLSAAMITTVLLYLICAGVYLTGQFFFVGTRALNCPIQMIKPIATAPLTILHAECFAFVLGLLGAIAMTAITAALSAKLSSPFTVIITSLLILLLPFGIAGGLPPSLQSILNLFPFSSNYSELFRINLYHIFNFKIWSPYMILFCIILITPLCLPIARRCYERHQVD